MKTNISIVSLTLLSALFACDPQDEVTPTVDQQEAQVTDGIAAADWKRPAQPNTKVGGQIVSEQQINVNVPSGATFETSYWLDPGYALTGVGLGITHGTVTGLRIKQRFIESNGTLGSAKIEDFGAGIYTTEVWAEVPTRGQDDYVITGVEVDAVDSENIGTLRIYYREISCTTPAVGCVKVSNTEFSAQDGPAVPSFDVSYRTANHSSNVSKIIISGIAFGYRQGRLFMGIAQAKLKGPRLDGGFQSEYKAASTEQDFFALIADPKVKIIRSKSDYLARTRQAGSVYAQLDARTQEAFLKSLKFKDGGLSSARLDIIKKALPDQ